MEAKQIPESELSYPTDHFNDQWKFWIWDNIIRVGCKKEIIVDILLSKHFSYDLINQELSYEKYLSENDNNVKLKKNIENLKETNNKLETIDEETISEQTSQGNTDIETNDNQIETIEETISEES